MALTDEQKKKIEEEELYRAKLSSLSPLQEPRKHGVPALLSLFIPGLGQIVKGQAGKGILILIGTIIGYIAFIIPGLILHIWQVADAYSSN